MSRSWAIWTPPSNGPEPTAATTAKVGITGFCWGGRITWLYAAHNPKVKAGVAWYGRLVGASFGAHAQAPGGHCRGLSAPVLGLYGGQDAGIPLDTVDKMKAALAAGNAAAKASQFVVYPDAPHAFHADYRPSYRQGPAEDGWKRALEWFKANGVADATRALTPDPVTAQGRASGLLFFEIKMAFGPRG
jgi:carboxymethylenebutenolidase